MEPFGPDELEPVLHKMKKHKAGGPDDNLAEFYKYLNPDIKACVGELINYWRCTEKVCPDITKARVAHIYKKGSSALFTNYRPISLLNILYKLYTKLIQQRLAKALDPYLHVTQFGFHAQRGTQHAIHIIRRLLEAGESSTSKLVLLLLEWEQAFDKITHDCFPL